MIQEIPETEEALLLDLSWNLEDSMYKAPEETVHWNRVMKTLRKHIPVPTLDWEFAVLCIFTLRTKEELENLIKKEK